MLVLSRKLDESVVLSIGDVEVEVTIKSTRGRSVSVGFDAPPEVRIMRKELTSEPDREAA